MAVPGVIISGDSSSTFPIMFELVDATCMYELFFSCHFKTISIHEIETNNIACGT